MFILCVKANIKIAKDTFDMCSGEFIEMSFKRIIEQFFLLGIAPALRGVKVNDMGWKANSM